MALTRFRIHFMACVIFICLATIIGIVAYVTQETKIPDHREGMDMRNEIVAYIKPLNRAQQIDVTNLVEKYIKLGDSLESVRILLLKNGFSMADYTDRKNADIKVVYATYEIPRNWWSKQTIVIYLWDKYKSGRVCFVLAQVNFKTV
jgi:hypothetical protein